MQMNPQQPNKVQNPETPVAKTPQMNERDFVNDMLATEKHMTNNYSVALNEASNNMFYQDLLHIFTETQNCQRELFDLMFKNGWYKLEQAEQQKITQSYQQHAGYMNQFPYQ
jgi:spore coat protein CotF